MSGLSTVELFKQDLKFSSGHFTIFSATHRENMHGHNYQVSVAISTQVSENGLNFDYRFYRDKVKVLCKQLNGLFLLPAHSKYLKIETNQQEILATFNNEKLSFLKRDAIVLPLSNITIEELSHWFLSDLVSDKEQLKNHAIQKIMVTVSSEPGQSGSAQWNSET